jgi:DNA-binding CsgD family transcriptional regulator
MAAYGKRTDYVSIVEACYRQDDSDDDWLLGVLDAARPLLDLGGGIALSMVQEQPEGRRIVLSRGAGRLSDMVRMSWPVIEQLDADNYRKLFYPRQPVVSTSSLAHEFSLPAQAALTSLLAQARTRDLMGMLGYPGEGWVFAMFVAVDEGAVTPGVREALRRLRIHVEASLRLRLFASADSVAIIGANGRVEHVRDGALDDELRAALGAQTANIERARSTRERADDEHALALWHALVEGRLSLVERVESDGKRFYHAFENAPHVRASRAMTDTEAVVLSLTLRGLSGKEVAYSTGLSQARISSALALAAERLGFTRREDLLRVGANLLQSQEEVTSAELTQAEQDVLALVRSGLSNHEIAVARGTSINTVANQLASLLRKTGATNRRALLVTSGGSGGSRQAPPQKSL